MTNDATRASALALPKMNRRNALAATGASVVAAFTAPPLHAEPADHPTLRHLIDAHREAYARFGAAIDRLDDARPRNRPEVYVPLTGGHGVSAHVSEDVQDTVTFLRQEIGRYYVRGRSAVAQALHRVSPDLATQATAALRKAEADDLRTMRRAIGEERARREASGYAAVVRERDEASKAEDAALDAILSYRCATVAEIAERANYLAHVFSASSANEDQVDLLLSSMRDGTAS